MSEHNWTTTLPTASGWYWWQYQGSIEVVRVDEDLKVWIAGSEQLVPLKEFRNSFWSGPIEPPPRETLTERQAIARLAEIVANLVRAHFPGVPFEPHAANEAAAIAAEFKEPEPREPNDPMAD